MSSKLCEDEIAEAESVDIVYVMGKGMYKQISSSVNRTKGGGLKNIAEV